MTRQELKEIIIDVMEQLEEPCEAPKPACLFSDNPCDVTTFYAVGEEG